MKPLRIALALVVGFLFACCSVITAQTTKEGSPSFEAGGVQIAIAIPWSNAVELRPEKRHFFDQFVPPSNRLIAGFAYAADLPGIHVQDIKAPPRIAVVAVSRQYESANIGESGFKQIIESAATNFNTTVSSYAKDNENSFNQKLIELNLDNAHLTIHSTLVAGVPVLHTRDCWLRYRDAGFIFCSRWHAELAHESPQRNLHSHKEPCLVRIHLRNLRR